MRWISTHRTFQTKHCSPATSRIRFDGYLGLIFYCLKFLKLNPDIMKWVSPEIRTRFVFIGIADFNYWQTIPYYYKLYWCSFSISCLERYVDVYWSLWLLDSGNALMFCLQLYVTHKNVQPWNGAPVSYHNSVPSRNLIVDCRICNCPWKICDL